MAAHPVLASMPWISLADRPAALVRADALAQALGLRELWLFRDDGISDTWSGSKLRKLEYLLADALARGARRLVTFGAAGSNHAVATALFGKALGFEVRLELAGQPKSPLVREQLLRAAATGAEIVAIDGVSDAYEKSVRGADRSTYVIAPGGSSVIGNVGFVAAALELYARGAVPPDVIVAAVGTMGSVAGLLVGTALAGKKTALIGVRCSSPASSSAEALARSAAELADFLRRRGVGPAELPPLRLEERAFGAGYGRPTRDGELWARRARDLAGVELEQTYTAKAVAALALLAPELREKRVLLWGSQPRYPAPPAVGCDRLPTALRGYCG
ncbi:MAG: pyridoxal-phosphate dependent enzyme [Myxococcales bacterium]|nr:pyridoxal-phosphate dependent enzyme [Myxococcales bacterium]